MQEGQPTVNKTVTANLELFKHLWRLLRPAGTKCDRNQPLLVAFLSFRACFCTSLKLGAKPLQHVASHCQRELMLAHEYLTHLLLPE